ERHAADFIAVLGEGQGFLAALVPSEWGPIPDANGPVEAGRSEAVAVRAERHTHAPVGVTTQDEYLPTGRRVPDARRLVFAARSKAPAGGADRNAFHLISGMQQGVEGPAGRRIPKFHGPVVAGRGQPFAVCAERQRANGSTVMGGDGAKQCFCLEVPKLQ